MLNTRTAENRTTAAIRSTDQLQIPKMGTGQDAQQKPHTNPTPQTTRKTQNCQTRTGNTVIPYTQGLCESLKNICMKYGI